MLEASTHKYKGDAMLTSAVLEELRQSVGPANLITDPQEKLVYECDGLIWFGLFPRR
jgi:hypothetical protein